MPLNALSRRRFLYLSGAMAAGAAEMVTAAPSGVLASRQHAAQVSLTFGESEWTNSLCTTITGTVIPTFTHLHPDIKVSMICSQDGGAFQSQMLSRIAAGNPIDVAGAWDNPASLAANKLVEPLDDLMAQSAHAQKKFWPATQLKDCVYKGKTYALPITVSSWAFFYNREWFEKKGIPADRSQFPKTWDELRKLSKEFTQWKGDTLVSAGYVPFRFTQDWDIPPTMYIWSVLNGGQLYDPEKRQYTIDSEPNIAMMDYMVSWLNEEFKGDMNAVDRSGNWSMHVDTQGRPPAFGLYQEAMGVEGSWILGGMYDSVMKFNRYDVASFPVGPGGTHTVSGSWPVWLVMPRGVQHREQAFAWMDYLGSTGMAAWTNAVPDIPSNKLVPFIAPAVVTKHLGKAFSTDVAHFFRHQASIAVPMFASPVEGFFETQFMRAVDRIMHKVDKPKAGLQACQQICQNRLQTVLAKS
jgi:ABC-type glycerol-3-phosphate transport system substrate-binding protein